MRAALTGLDSGVDAVVTACVVAERRIRPGTDPDGQLWDMAFDATLGRS
jgi:hypothetical protein